MELRDERRKRAANMVWTAAGRYDFEPEYLFYETDGEPSLYLNTLQGLAYAGMDEEVILPFLKGLECGREPERFRAMALLILEEAVFLRQSGDRPALADLREEHARRHREDFHRPERYTVLGWERQELIRDCRVLDGGIGGTAQLAGEPDRAAQPAGEPDAEPSKAASLAELPGMASFDSREIALAEALVAAAHLPEPEMVAAAKRIFARFFFYRFVPSRKSETIDFVGAGMLIALFAKLTSRSTTSQVSLQGNPEEKGGSGSRIHTIWKHLMSQTTEAEDRSFILQTFGECMFPEEQMSRIEASCCSGYHGKCRLWYTGSSSPDEQFGRETEEQRRKNLDRYRENYRLNQRSIRQITDHLKHALEEQQEPDTVHLQSGRLDGRQVYRIRTMHDLAVFCREIVYPTPDFTVDLVLDSSSSRREEQENIAVQAYIITRSLMNLEIPVQVTAFRSMRNYTVFHLFKSYSETESADGIFRYYAAGNNRDGLAFRALRPLMELSDQGMKKRIVLVLTDALPADTCRVPLPGHLLRGPEYDDALALEDTREAVQLLRRDGTRVAAIFWGESYAMPGLKQIYGDSFARILSVTQLPDAVIGLLLRILSELRDPG